MPRHAPHSLHWPRTDTFEHLKTRLPLVRGLHILDTLHTRLVHTGHTRRRPRTTRTHITRSFTALPRSRAPAWVLHVYTLRGNFAAPTQLGPYAHTRAWFCRFVHTHTRTVMRGVTLIIACAPAVTPPPHGACRGPTHACCLTPSSYALALRDYVILERVEQRCSASAPLSRHIAYSAGACTTARSFFCSIAV